MRLTQHTVQRNWFTPQRTVIVCTDACSSGWGAWYKHVHGFHFVQNTWPSVDIQLTHNNYLELRAVREAICSAHFSKVFIRVFSDNMSTVHMLNKFFTQVETCALELKQILTYTLAHDCAVKAYHVPGKLNHVADYLSR